MRYFVLFPFSPVGMEVFNLVAFNMILHLLTGSRCQQLVQVYKR